MIPELNESDIPRAFPWVPQLRAILASSDVAPFIGSHILVGSDYTGRQRDSDYLVYAFLLADADQSPTWPQAREAVRRQYLQDGRRMSFKGLNDGQRRRALVPFLNAGDLFHGL